MRAADVIWVTVLQAPWLHTDPHIYFPSTVDVLIHPVWIPPDSPLSNISPNYQIFSCILFLIIPSAHSYESWSDSLCRVVESDDSFTVANYRTKIEFKKSTKQNDRMTQLQQKLWDYFLKLGLLGRRPWSRILTLNDWEVCLNFDPVLARDQIWRISSSRGKHVWFLTSDFHSPLVTVETFLSKSQMSTFRRLQKKSQQQHKRSEGSQC